MASKKTNRGDNRTFHLQKKETGYNYTLLQNIGTMVMVNYLLNLISLARGHYTLRPLVGIFHLTGQCNLKCVYCEDYGARRPNDELFELGVLSLDQAGQVLSILRQATANLILTGGEPLLYPVIDALVAQAKAVYHFKNLTMLTNGLLLSKHLNLLPLLDRLVISLDSLNAGRWGQIIGVGQSAAQAIIDTLVDLAQQPIARRLIVNCVVTPATLADAGEVLDFCVEHNLAFAFSPQSFNNWPHYQLLVAEKYPIFVDKVIAYKKQGAKILGSLAYLKLMRQFQPFNCYPTLAPRVLPNGDLIYPCRPIERSHTPHGGRPCNLTQVTSWSAAQASAAREFGAPPTSCGSCFQQCYAEPSLMQAQPLSLLGEWLTFRASRQLKLHTFAPG
jgi:MoaA/NifB/PqqE/SkfB family radical SAM enzyme